MVYYPTITLGESYNFIMSSNKFKLKKHIENKTYSEIFDSLSKIDFELFSNLPDSCKDQLIIKWTEKFISIKDLIDDHLYEFD